MSTLPPLPDYRIQPVQTPNVLDQYSKLMALQNQMQEAPLRQQALQQSVQSGQLNLQDQQQQLAARKALNDAYSSAVTTDPTTGQQSFDPDKLTRSLASGPAAYQIPAVQKNITDYQKSKIDLQSAAADLQAKNSDMLGSAAAAIKAANYDPTLAHSLLDGLPQTPQLAQIRQQIDNPQALQQLVNTAIQNSPKQRELMASETTAGSRALEAKYKVVNGTLMDVSGQTPQPAMAGQLNPQQWSQAVDAVVPPDGANRALNQRTHAQVDFYIRQGNTDAAQKAITQAADQVGAVERETNPLVQQGKVQVATAEGQARANIEAQVARGSDAALATVPPHLVGPATAAATKAGTDYAQAQSVSQSIAEMMDAAKKGNVVSYQLLPQEGALQVSTSQGVHRINMAEIENYGGGSLVQSLEGHLGKALTGQSIPPSVLSDMAQMQDVMQRGAQAKYENTLSTINQTYGAKFKPVTMKSTAPSAKGGGQGQGGGITVTAPNGKTYSFNDQASADAFKQKAGIQ